MAVGARTAARSYAPLLVVPTQPPQQIGLRGVERVVTVEVKPVRIDRGRLRPALARRRGDGRMRERNVSAAARGLKEVSGELGTLYSHWSSSIAIARPASTNDRS